MGSFSDYKDKWFRVRNSREQQTGTTRSEPRGVGAAVYWSRCGQRWPPQELPVSGSKGSCLWGKDIVHWHTHLHVLPNCYQPWLETRRSLLRVTYTYVCTYTHTRTHICIYIHTYRHVWHTYIHARSVRMYIGETHLDCNVTLNNCRVLLSTNVHFSINQEHCSIYVLFEHHCITCL